MEVILSFVIPFQYLIAIFQSLFVRRSITSRLNNYRNITFLRQTRYLSWRLAIEL